MVLIFTEANVISTYDVVNQSPFFEAAIVVVVVVVNVNVVFVTLLIVADPLKFSCGQ